MIQLHRGDCLKFLKRLPEGTVDAVVCDPPWGIDADTDYTRFSAGPRTQGRWPNRNHWIRILGDNFAFDPTPWLQFPHVALWGAHCFSGHLPVGQWLVWIKKRDRQFNSFLSDAELCWTNKKPTNRRAPGVYCYRHNWSGFDRETERGKVLHPTQKPVALMRWCIERLKLKPGSTILDPYMGSGPVGIAAVEMGHNYIGCEIDRTYFAIAKRRIQAAEACAAQLTA